METTALERIDSYPYRHTLAEVMAAPVVSLDTDQTMREAVAIMQAKRIGAVVVAAADGTAAGIVTERDVLRLAADDPGLLDRKLSTVMSSPLEGLPADAFLYRAIARMDRLGIRHLAVLDSAGRAIGMVSARNLLRQRAAAALRLGDQVDRAADAAALARVQASMPDLARALLGEGVPATQVSAVISAVTRDMSARAAELAVEAMHRDGLGAAPARWCLLILGSGGRGESLLAPDQDNALIHTGTTDDDKWFAAFAERLNALLDVAGIPLCRGNVMAKNAAWRHTLDGWNARIASWIAHPEGEALLNVDIFYDCRAVAGDAALAQSLRKRAVAMAQAAPTFLRLLAANAENLRAPLGLWGAIKTDNGRVDLKKGGLLPIVTAARVIALKLGIDAVQSDERLELAGQRLPNTENLQGLARARAVIVQTILGQQLADIAAGLAPGNRVDPARLDRFQRRALTQALREAAGAETLIADALTS